MSKSANREVLRLAIPALGQGLISTILLFTDRLILGRYDDLALGAMQISGTLMWSVFSVLGAFSIGVLAIIGRSIGENNPSRIAQSLSTAFTLALGLGIAVAVIGYHISPQLCLWVGGSTVSDEARSLPNAEALM